MMVIEPWQNELLSAVREAMNSNHGRTFTIHTPLSVLPLVIRRVYNTVVIRFDGESRSRIEIEGNSIEIFTQSKASSLIVATLMPFLEIDKSGSGRTLMIPNGSSIFYDDEPLQQHSITVDSPLKVRPTGSVIQTPYWYSFNDDYIWKIILDAVHLLDLDYDPCVYVGVVDEREATYVNLPYGGKLYREPDLVGTFFN